MPSGPGELSLRDLKNRIKSRGEGGCAREKSQEVLRERRKELALGWEGEGREKVPNQPDLRVSSMSMGSTAAVPFSVSTAVTQFDGREVFQSG